MRGGAISYLLKTTEGDDLTAAIRRAMDGDSVVAPEMMSKLVAADGGKGQLAVAIQVVNELMMKSGQAPIQLFRLPSVMKKL